MTYGENVVASFGQDQAVTNTNGTKLTVFAQKAKSTGGNGGDLELQSGMFTGGGTAGNIILKSGDTTVRVTINDSGTWTLSSGTVFTSSSGTVRYDASNTAYLGSTTRRVVVDHVGGGISAQAPTTEFFSVGSVVQDLLRFKWVDSGAGSIEVDAGKTSMTYGWVQKTGDAATALTTIAGQRASSTATGANEHGGNILIAGGQEDGAGSRGDVALQSLNLGVYSPAATDADVTVNASDSTNSWFFVSGAKTAARNFTVTRRPTSGNGFFFKSNATGGFNQQVGFLTGTRFNVPDGQLYWIYGDGTNAQGERIQ